MAESRPSRAHSSGRLVLPLSRSVARLSFEHQDTQPPTIPEPQSASRWRPETTRPQSPRARPARTDLPNHRTAAIKRRHTLPGKSHALANKQPASSNQRLACPVSSWSCPTRFLPPPYRYLRVPVPGPISVLRLFSPPGLAETDSGPFWLHLGAGHPGGWLRPLQR